MKKILTLIMLFLTMTTLHAEWETITLQEHIKSSSLIVIAEFEKEIEKKETEAGEVQLVSFRPVESIKGDIDGSFVVEGTALFICMPQMIFPVTPDAKYLLFLIRGDDGHYQLTHGRCSGLLIESNKVNWVENKSKIDWGSVPMSIDKVKREIELTLGKSTL